MEREHNIFVGGMDKDTSVSYQQKNTYTDAWNVRLITDEGFSNGALINLKGNEERVILPGDANLINYPIGWGMIRDTLFIFCETLEFNPSSSKGSIYKVIFDESNNSTNVSLLYSHVDLNFNREFLIGEAIGRYETENIQRLYWTDGLNNIRTINVVDPNIINLDPVDLNLNSSVTFNPLFVEAVEQEGGNLETGVYYYTYRLKGSDDQYTPYAPVIGPINIIKESDEGSNYAHIEGNDTVTEPIPITSKYVRLTLNNEAPNSYDTLEVVYLYQNVKDGVFTINQFIRQKASSGVMKISHFGNEEGEIPVTLSEISASFTSITTCKTIKEKGNRLFLGNITSENTDILNWDATVKRYPTSTTLPFEGKLAKCGVDQVSTFNYSTQQFEYKYKSNGKTFGAEGVNVSVEFKTEEIRIEGIDDNTTSISGAGSKLKGANGYTTRSLWDGYVSMPVFGQPANKLVSTYANPLKSSYIRGYQRGEFYRFGIILYGLSGEPNFVKWIGDIKMPEIYDHDDFVLSKETNVGGSTHTNNKIVVDGKILYPEFTVDISSIKSTISGFSIVRVERKDEDKTIITQGLLNPTQITSTDKKLRPFQTGAGLYPPQSCLQNLRLLKSLRSSAAASSVPGSEYPKVDICTLDGPDSHLKKYTFSNGDFLRVVSTLISNTYDYNMDIYHPLGGHRFGGAVSGILEFNYSPSDEGEDGVSNVFALQDSKSLGKGEDGSIDKDDFLQDFYSSFTQPKKTFSPTLVCKIKGGALTSTPNLKFDTQDVRKRELCNYIRPRNNQYGGNSETAYTLNDYILTGHYQKVDKNTNSYTAKVFGGDTFINWYGYCKSEEGDWDDKIGIPIPITNVAYGTYYQYFPVESTFNTDLRSGNTLKMLLGDDGDGNNTTNLERVGETFEYNTLFSSVNKSSIYKAKPFDVVISEKFDTRIYYTEEKVNGNTQDDWTVIRLDDYHELSSKYGGLNRLEVLNDKMFAFQDKGISILSINPRALLQGDTSDLVLGSGAIIDDIVYLSTSTGCRHRFGVVSSNDYVYFVDTFQKKFKRIGPKGIEELKGLDGFLRLFISGNIENTDNLWLGAGVVCAYDPIYNEVLFTLKNNLTTTSNGSGTGSGTGTGIGTSSIVETIPVINSRSNDLVNSTICFNERTNTFTSFYSPVPYMYMNTGNRLLYPDLSLNKGNGSLSLYESNVGDYNNFSGNFYDSSIEFVSNPGPADTKVFDNLVFFTEVTKEGKVINTKSFDRIKCKTGYQNSDYVTLTYKGNMVRKDRGMSIVVPRNVIKGAFDEIIDINSASNFDNTRVFKERLRDKYMITEVIFNNINNYRLVTHYIETVYRKNYR